jgi:hypothetical protein
MDGRIEIRLTSWKRIETASSSEIAAISHPKISLDACEDVAADRRARPSKAHVIRP